MEKRFIALDSHRHHDVFEVAVIRYREQCTAVVITKGAENGFVAGVVEYVQQVGNVETNI